MICPKCKERWASFPENDFEFTEGRFIALNVESEHQRRIIFESGRREYCGCEDEDWDPYFYNKEIK